MEKNSKTEQQHCFKPKASGGGTASVIPVKRRIVKRIMFDEFCQVFCSVFKTNQKPKPPNTKKKIVFIISNHIYPSPP
ncbi:hypothetical protein Pyn_24627 [Prunus yedoensis var. nudiflora]|uniref:Uncharacterized protein n=1 Tax=Prunus yedoensis var. nudiflora TaxID=2094558 RepID=A0A314UYV0_PRUYE|nr:hypothetical protein Pyn_24627 [Prunus yedoensis var. nudiflora]